MTRDVLPLLVLDERADLPVFGLTRWRAHRFQSVHDALEAVSHLQPPVALARLDKSGLELARKLSTRDPTLPVVLLASAPSAERLWKALRLGVRDVVPLEADPSATATALTHSLDDALSWRLGLLRGAELGSTELREALGARQRRVEALEERVRELAAQLAAETSLLAQTQQQLEVQRERALAALRAKGRFLSNVGHELNTPLNAIIGYAEMLREELPDPAARMDADHIVGAARRLQGLLQEVLHLARLEAGQVNPVFEPVSVEDLTRAAMDRVAASAKTAGVELRLGPRETDQIVTDPARLGEALDHLLDNAVKFSHRPGGGGLVELSVLRDGTDDRTDVVLAVRDDGIGVRPEDMQRIFEAFTQADGSSTRTYGGTGLGLSVAAQVVRVLGGTLDATSEPGRGSCFEIRLPEVAVTTVHVGQGQDLTVLVVDDDPVLRTLLQRMLIADGHAAVVTGSAERVIELARAHRPALIALDVMLPGQDGWSVLDALRADPTVSDIPVVMLSSDPHPEHAADRGACGFLDKPVDREALRSAIALHARRDARVGLAVGAVPACLDALVRDGLLRRIPPEELADALAVRTTPYVLLDPAIDADGAAQVLTAVARRGQEVALVVVDPGFSDDERSFLERHLHAVLPPAAAADRLRSMTR